MKIIRIDNCQSCHYSVFPTVTTGYGYCSLLSHPAVYDYGIDEIKDSSKILENCPLEEATT